MKQSSHTIKRNKLDIIITDLLPAELSKVFTISSFYEYLMSKEDTLDKVIKQLEETKYGAKKLFSNNWHASPLKFPVMKNDGGLREISLVNPFSMIQIYYFITLYNNELLNLLSNNAMFSIRYHKRNDRLYYKHSYKGKVYYNIEKTKVEIFQASGKFYKIEPYQFLADFYSSNEWFILNLKYEYFGKIDYNNCFGSIYTHSFKWIYDINTVESRELSKSNDLLSTLDRLLQQINSSITNGIVVGPEFTRLASEILLQKIDKQVYNRLIKDHEYKKDFEIRRFVDDVFIFTNNKYLRDQIINIYREESLRFQLTLNERKTIKGTFPHIWNEWKFKSKHFIKELNQVLFYNYKDKKQHIIKAKKKYSTSLKDAFNTLIANYQPDATRIVSYILGFIINKMKTDNKNLFSKNTTIQDIARFIDLILFIYAHGPNYHNTDRLLTIFMYIEEDLGHENVKSSIKKYINNYFFIFEKSTLEDIIDLLLIFKIYDIELPTNIENNILHSITKKDNPILAACYLIYAKYDDSYSQKVTSTIEDIVIDKLSNIPDENSQNILLYQELWWLFIFWECPYFQPETIDNLKNKLELLKSTDKRPNQVTKNILYEFLKDDNKRYTFINWELKKEDFFDKIDFFTTRRTIFQNKFDAFTTDY